MTDALVDAVARALYAQEWASMPNAPEFGGDGTPKSYWLASARAALAAIEASGTHVVAPIDPAPAMLDAASHANNPHTAYWSMLSARPKQEG